MFAVIGPLRIRPSACRGEATMSMPYLEVSKLTLAVALISSSQPLQPPAETERSLSDRPNSFRIAADAATGPNVLWPSSITRPSRLRDAMRYPAVNLTLSCGQMRAHSSQKTQRPRSRAKDPSRIAVVGHTSAQSLQPSWHGAASMTGRPRKPMGLAERTSGTNCLPCAARTLRASMNGLIRRTLRSP